MRSLDIVVPGSDVFFHFLLLENLAQGLLPAYACLGFYLCDHILRSGFRRHEHFGVAVEGGQAVIAQPAPRLKRAEERDGDKGDDVLTLKKRLQELGYIRSGATLTNRYTQETAQRVILFQRQTGMTEDGVAWQELQAYLFSDKAPACSQTLPRIRTKVADKRNRMICGCCMGEGCECCNFTGYVYN